MKYRSWDPKDHWKTSPKRYSNSDLLYKGLQSIAHRRLKQAIDNGTMRRGPACYTCGVLGKTAGHHYRGYEYPFDVWWLCSRCNANLKGPQFHNGTVSLEDCREYIINKYFVRIDRHYRSLGKKRRPCDVCGIWDMSEFMVMISDTLEMGKIFYCQHHFHLMY